MLRVGRRAFKMCGLGQLLAAGGARHCAALPVGSRTALCLPKAGRRRMGSVAGQGGGAVCQCQARGCAGGAGPAQRRVVAAAARTTGGRQLQHLERALSARASTANTQAQGSVAPEPQQSTAPADPVLRPAAAASPDPPRWFPTGRGLQSRHRRRCLRFPTSSTCGATGGARQDRRKRVGGGGAPEKVSRARAASQAPPGTPKPWSRLDSRQGVTRSRQGTGSGSPAQLSRAGGGGRGKGERGKGGFGEWCGGPRVLSRFGLLRR